MGVIRRITNTALGVITTSQILSITTSETLYTIQSGSRAVEMTNLSTTTVYYGMSNVALNSGGLLLGNAAKFWDSITGDFQLYLRITTAAVTAQVIAQEYAGN